MAEKKQAKSPDKKSQALVKEDPLKSLTKDTVHRYINQLATETEIGQFLHLCATWSLDPFKREIYLIKYSMKDPATIVMGYEVFLKRAERTGKISGWKHWTEGQPKQKDFKACIEIHRKDWEFPFVHEVWWDEYAQYRADGKLNKFWNSKPRTMLLKVADAQGFRLCFPDDLGGMPYTAEEMPKTEEVLEAVIVEEEKKTSTYEQDIETAKKLADQSEPPKEEKKESPRETTGKVEKPKPKPKPQPKPKPEPKQDGPHYGDPDFPEEEKIGDPIAKDPEPQDPETPENEQPEEEESEKQPPLAEEKPEAEQTTLATDDQKKDILDKMKFLQDEFNRDEEDLRKKMAGHLKKAYGTVINPVNIPGDCDYKEAKNLIVSLDMTIESMTGEKL